MMIKDELIRIAVIWNSTRTILSSIRVLRGSEMQRRKITEEEIIILITKYLEV